MIKKRNLILIDLKIIIINDMIKKHYKQKKEKIIFLFKSIKNEVYLLGYNKI